MHVILHFRNGSHEQAERNRAVDEIQRKFGQLETKYQKLEEMWLNDVCASNGDKDGNVTTTLGTDETVKMRNPPVNSDIRTFGSNGRRLSGTGTINFRTTSPPKINESQNLFDK